MVELQSTLTPQAGLAEIDEVTHGGLYLCKVSATSEVLNQCEMRIEHNVGDVDSLFSTCNVGS